jgi:hypothetical protein
MSNDRDSETAAALSTLVPPINRARDYRLYTSGGQRIIDLWQYGGRAVLGHNPPGVLRELKNSAERGLFAPLPHPRNKRLDQALSRLFPGRAIRVYTGECSLHQALASAGFPWSAFPDPAFAPETAFDDASPALWRPFLTVPLFPGAGTGDGASIQAKLLRCPVLIPFLPLPWPGAPCALVLKTELAGRFPPSDLISPPVLAAAARSVCALIAALPGREKTPPFQKRISPNRNKWRIRGIYLYYQDNTERSHTFLFEHFLRRDFLLPPNRQDPVILPGLLSPGEAARLAALLTEATTPP